MKHWVLPFVEDPLLWPVLLVVIGHVVALVAPVLLLAVRDRRIPAMGALALLVGLSVSIVNGDVRRRGRPAMPSAFLLVTWLLSGAAAVAAHRYDLF